MTRSEHYRDSWDGICGRCGHDYFECRGNCTCLSCNAQRQAENARGLRFDEDAEDESELMARAVIVRLRVTRLEKERLQKAAAESAQTLSQYIRDRLGI